jgi:putative LysE/RhtB family amino acid efflux pump
MDPPGFLLILGASADLFARTFIIGVVVAAPVGAMGILCIQRVLAHGWRAGLATGAGIALADSLFAALAAFGLSAVARAMIDYQAQFRIVGGLALLWLGWRAMRTPPAVAAAKARDSTRLTTLFASAVGLTLANPMTIMAFAAIFAGAGLAAQPGPGGAVVVTAGVACGSLAWWLALSTGVSGVRHAVSDRAMVIVNRISGGVLAAFGLFALVTGAAVYSSHVQ